MHDHVMANSDFACESISPAMAFSPAQNHEIELPVTLINQVPCVPAKEDKLLNREQGATCGDVQCIIKRSQMRTFCHKL